MKKLVMSALALAAVAAFADKVALKIEFPPPHSSGTPKEIKSDNLEPDPGPGMTGNAEVTALATDPETGWQAMGPYFLHETNAYGAWKADAGEDTPYDIFADVAALAAMTGQGVEGAIMGKALYAGRFSLEQALAVAGGAAVEQARAEQPGPVAE